MTTGNDKNIRVSTVSPWQLTEKLTRHSIQGKQFILNTDPLAPLPLLSQRSAMNGYAF